MNISFFFFAKIHSQYHAVAHSIIFPTHVEKEAVIGYLIQLKVGRLDNDGSDAKMMGLSSW